MTQAQVGTDQSTAPMSDRSRWIALYVLCAGMLMIVLDITVVNVALPSIKSDLGFNQSSLAWVVNAYLITFGGLLLLAGRLGDLIGRRTIFLVGLAVFVAASMLCGASQSEAMLIGARLLQGIGGAMTSAVILGMIVTMFPEPAEQAKAVGVYAFVASAGGAVGLLLGGVITQVISWHWIFFVNVPIGLATALLARRLLENDKGIGFGEGADLLGAVLITASLMLGVYTIVEPAAKDGWGAATTLVLGAGSLVAARRASSPARRPRRTPADPAADLPLAQRHRREPGPGPDRGRDVRDVLHGLALPAAGPGLRRPPDRTGLPAGHDHHGDAHRPVLGAADHALRRPDAALPGPWPGRRRTGALHAGPGRRQLLHRRPAGPRPAGHRDRRLLPRADDDRDVRAPPGPTRGSPRAW